MTRILSSSSSAFHPPSSSNSKMPSPTKESIPNLPPHATTELLPPPSPRTHRALRRLQSAHSLGAKASGMAPSASAMTAGTAGALPVASLISQQRLREREREHHLQEQFRHLSPVRRDPSAGTNRSPQRGRANSDAPTPMVQHLHALASRRSLMKRTNGVANGLSLQQLLRDGPPDGDVAGALESARIKILDEGIKSDSDGMVSF